MCEEGRWGSRGKDEEGVKIQLLSSSSVAVSTSQDFDDNATITAFWEEKQKALGFILRQNSATQCTAGEGKKLRDTYFFKAHGTEFVYFACVLRTGDGSACIDMRPEPRCLFEHLWVLLVLCDGHVENNSKFMGKGFSIPLSITHCAFLLSLDPPAHVRLRAED